MGDDVLVYSDAVWSLFFPSLLCRGGTVCTYDYGLFVVWKTHYALGKHGIATNI